MLFSKSSNYPIGLDISDLSLKLVQLIKKKTPNNLIDIIGAEIEKHIPLTIKEINYDWQIIEEKRDKYSVLIGAAPQNIVNQYIDLLNEANLSISALEIESTAICRSLLAVENPEFKGKFDKNYSIIDIGAKRTSMTIYSQNTIVLSISIPISGQEITERIAKTLEIKNEQAEKAKIICGLDKNKAQGIIHKILSNIINELNHKIKDTLEFYHNHYPDRGPINEILLCGGGSKVKNIDQIISQSINIDTKKGNTFINLPEPDKKFTQNFLETHNLNWPCVIFLLIKLWRLAYLYYVNIKYYFPRTKKGNKIKINLSINKNSFLYFNYCHIYLYYYTSAG